MTVLPKAGLPKKTKKPIVLHYNSRRDTSLLKSRAEEKDEWRHVYIHFHFDLAPDRKLRNWAIDENG
jgi:hypothetical protein